MKGKDSYNSVDYSYVFSAKKKLELDHGKKSATNFGRMKNKWTAAAVIALASGSVVLFVPTGKAQAAEAAAGVKTEQVETNKQTDQAQQKQVKQPTQGEDEMIKLIKIHQINR
ncbi:MAG: hypothetical protein K8V49_05295 [Lactobacillus gallinarum]|uniref:hypothetical protein n=1 Tax=Lactobacillus gallinarum TaxID=52242 RepID=UPI00174A522C|nr:hypothetical protein [Lactobacillus gallinarum]MCC9272022.1 hypothetical protein [Lactobacillus gallinarum]